MTQDTYAVIIFWSDDDEAFIASVPELPGCNAHGETRGQAIAEIEIAIENWIDTARAIGREIPSPTQDWAAKEKELDEKARESLKIGFQNAMPEIIEALAKQIAKPGTDVLLRYSRERGIEWLTRTQQSGSTPRRARRNVLGRDAGPPIKRAVRKS
jgi:predicted RNase H-like HicB family nuclease